jgi:uncharacterized protein (DUF488 family)
VAGVEAETPIRTIGYGSRSIDELVSALEAASTDHLVDVRSAPYSRFKPEFSKEPLAARLEREGIRYVFMGDALGGRPDDPSCYDADGRVNYERCRLRPAFQDGLTSLEAGWEGGHRIVLMCSEGKPQECHRTKLVAEELVRMGVPVAHIDEHGMERSHEAVMESITNGQGTLFGASAAAAKSRKKHRAA